MSSLREKLQSARKEAADEFYRRRDSRKFPSTERYIPEDFKPTTSSLLSTSSSNLESKGNVSPDRLISSPLIKSHLSPAPLNLSASKLSDKKSTQTPFSADKTSPNQLNSEPITSTSATKELFHESKLSPLESEEFKDYTEENEPLTPQEPLLPSEPIMTAPPTPSTPIVPKNESILPTSLWEKILITLIFVGFLYFQFVFSFDSINFQTILDTIIQTTNYLLVQLYLSLQQGLDSIPIFTWIHMIGLATMITLVFDADIQKTDANILKYSVQFMIWIENGCQQLYQTHQYFIQEILFPIYHKIQSILMTCYVKYYQLPKIIRQINWLFGISLGIRYGLQLVYPYRIWIFLIVLITCGGYLLFYVYQLMKQRQQKIQLVYQLVLNIVKYQLTIQPNRMLSYQQQSNTDIYTGCYVPDDILSALETYFKHPKTKTSTAMGLTSFFTSSAAASTASTATTNTTSSTSSIIVPPELIEEFHFVSSFHPQYTIASFWKEIELLMKKDKTIQKPMFQINNAQILTWKSLVPPPTTSTVLDGEIQADNQEDKMANAASNVSAKATQSPPLNIPMSKPSLREIFSPSSKPR